LPGWPGSPAATFPTGVPVTDVTLGALAIEKLSRLLAKDPVTSPLRAPFTAYQGTHRGRRAHRRRASADARHDMLTTDGWRAAAIAADVIAKRWQEPDAGIWELDDSRRGIRRVPAATPRQPSTGVRPRLHP
jgi:hypothetical protein